MGFIGYGWLALKRPVGGFSDPGDSLSSKNNSLLARGMPEGPGERYTGRAAAYAASRVGRIRAPYINDPG